MQTLKSIKWLKQRLLLLDQFLHDCNSSVHNSQKAFNYRIFKTDYKFKEYFSILDEQNANIELFIINCPSKREDGVIFLGKTTIANFIRRIKLETNIITYLN